MIQNIHEIEPVTLKQWIDNGDAILIDVREVEEYNAEHIGPSELHPLSSFDPHIIPQGNGKKIIFHCKGGKRSVHAATKWADYLGAPDAFSLKGGLDAWKKAGLSTLSNEAASRDIQKITYISSGVLVLLGSIAAGVLSPWFLLLPVFAGTVLLYAGIKGTSYLSYLVSRIRRKKPLD
jgi:rhodanese-related sulfurtransferase